MNITDDNNYKYVLEMRNVSKSFSGVKALDNVSLKVKKGSVHALVGENGAGKSTLMKILCGEYQIDEGEIYFKGKKVEIENTQTALDLGISYIHQELSPILDMTIAENIFLGREPTYGNGMFVDFDRLYSEAEKLLLDMSLMLDPHCKMRELSVAERQLVEIIKAISRGASLIVMDEPTSAITEREVEILFEKIRELKARGVSIIFITHKLDEIFEVADDITVIRDGKWIDSNCAEYYDKAKLITLMVGRTINDIFPKKKVKIGDTAIEVKNISTNGVFEDISFKVRKGEILGVAGLVGAGRTEVARAIFGLDPIDSGEIIMNDKSLKIRTPYDAISNGIVMVPEDRRELGLVMCRSIRENISLPNLEMLFPGPLINEGQEVKLVNEMVKKLQIKTPYINLKVNKLSGGNQQKVVIAKWLIREIKVLILDEPTRGIDVGSKSEIHKLIGDLAETGVAIIMISSELPEILGMSDRIIVMHEGKLTGELSRQEASQEKIMTLATGECI